MTSVPQPPSESQPFLPSLAQSTSTVSPVTDAGGGKLAYDSFGLTESRRHQDDDTVVYDESGTRMLSRMTKQHTPTSDAGHKRTLEQQSSDDDSKLESATASPSPFSVASSSLTSVRTHTPSLLAQHHKVLAERSMLISLPTIPVGASWYNPRYWPHRVCGSLLELMTYSNLQTSFVVLLGNGFILLVLVMLAERIGLHWPFEVAPLNNWMFTCANVSLILSYTSSDILFLRIVLSLAGVFFCVWSATFPIGVLTDTLMWNYLMMLINLRHALILIYNSRTIRFDAYREEVYMHVFKGIMTRSDFSVLIKPSLIRYHNDGRYYAKAGDACHELSLIVQGSFELEKVADKKKLKKMMSKHIVKTPKATDTKKRHMEAKKMDSLKKARSSSDELAHLKDGAKGIDFDKRRLWTKKKKPSSIFVVTTPKMQPKANAIMPPVTGRVSPQMRRAYSSNDSEMFTLDTAVRSQPVVEPRVSVGSGGDFTPSLGAMDSEQFLPGFGATDTGMMMLQSAVGAATNYGMGATFGYIFDGGGDERDSDTQPEEKEKKLVTSCFEFIDSPEWVMRRSKWGQRYSVSFRATEDCVLLMWPREALIELLKENPTLETPLMGVLGVDVARKLFKTN